MASPTIAVLVPCYNEELTIGEVIDGFRANLPGARIYVYDNNSTDRTAEVALAHGAALRRERLQGKGNVVRRMFADVDADIYVLVDGDATYDAAAAPDLVRMLVDNQYDMVTAKREAMFKEAYRPGHRFGNGLLTWMVSALFGTGVSDMLSGYRILSRRFVKTFPALSSGFEIETELTVHALQMRMAMGEMPTPYLARPEGSASKLNTYRDGLRILATITQLVRDERPLAFFSALASLTLTLAVVLAVPIFIEFGETGLVPRFPTAILCTGLSLVSVVLFSCGLMLDTVSRGRRETMRLHYLSYKAPAPAAAPSDAVTVRRLEPVDA
ncbi:MAG TPA: glycosyltransferase family 2 protein [Magnetospirillum sp.]|nr:glycosyltransferase family 2 protein [Magnetospirillum sp.]